MGIARSTPCQGNHYLSCLENKKITTLKPVYLIYTKSSYQDTPKNSPNKNKSQLIFNINKFEYYELIIKINCNLCFNIINATTYGIGLGGPNTFEFDVIFLNNVKLTDVEILKAPTEYLEFVKTQTYLKLYNLVYIDHLFFNHRDYYNKDDVLDNSYYGNPNKYSDKDKLDYIATKYKDYYLVEDI